MNAACKPEHSEGKGVPDERPARSRQAGITLAGLPTCGSISLGVCCERVIDFAVKFNASK